MKNALSRIITALIIAALVYGAYKAGPHWCTTIFLLLALSIVFNRVTVLEKTVQGLVEQLAVKETDGEDDKEGV